MMSPSWRRKRDIPVARQNELQMRLEIAVNIKAGQYPFAGLRLLRADVEWLLIHHSETHGEQPALSAADMLERPVGVDFRGALMYGLDLSHLPLAGCRFGLSFEEWGDLFPGKEDTEQDVRCYRAEIGRKAATRLECATFFRTDLRDATFYQGRLEGATFLDAHLEGAFLREAHLAHREVMTGDTLDKPLVEDATFIRLLRRRNPRHPSVLPAANLHLAYFDAGTSLNDVYFGSGESGVRLADVRWGGANIAVAVRLRQVTRLGDEVLARRLPKGCYTKRTRKEDDLPSSRTDAYVMATRANQQVSELLRGQGLSSLSNDFAYRSKVCERAIFLRQGRLGSAVVSLVLDVLAGYGYRVKRSFAWYIGVIAVFALIFAVFAPGQGPLAAALESIASFHGGGLMQAEAVAKGDPLAVVSALETVIGFLLGATFIATYTQRFLSR